MKVILLEDMKTLGKTGDSVEVAPGYARNYLVPRKLAVGDTAQNKAVFENEKKARGKRQDKDRSVAQDLAGKISAVSVTIARMAGEENKLFGSVTNADIAQALAAEGITVDKRKIILPTPIKTISVTEVAIHLHANVDVSVKVTVVKQGGDEDGGETETVQSYDAPLLTIEEQAEARQAVAEKKAAREKPRKSEEETSGEAEGE